MLLVGPHRSVQSLRPAALTVPFVYERLGANVQAIRAFLSRLPASTWLTQALEQELTGHIGSVPLHGGLGNDLLEAAASGIAGGSIAVGRVVPKATTVRFDRTNPSARNRFSALVFPSRDIAAHFLRDLLRLPGAIEAFQQAVAAAAENRSLAQTAVPAWDPVNTVQVLAPLLAGHRLLLVRPASYGRHPSPGGAITWPLQLQWLEHNGPLIGVAAAPPAPAAAPAAAPPSEAPPASVLPDPPAEVSPQAQTLIDAAQDGTPFCEECARAAAANV